MYNFYSLTLGELAKICEQSKKKTKIEYLKEKKKQAAGMAKQYDCT